jgi:hypothetical protein
LPPLQLESNAQVSQYLRVLQRSSAGGSGTFAVSAVPNSLKIQLDAIVLNPGEGIRFAAAQALLADPLDSNKVTIVNAVLKAAVQEGFGPVVAQSPPIAPAVILSGGMNLFFSSAEIFFWNDYLEVGGVPPGVRLQLEADTLSTALVDTSINWSMSVLYERLVWST